MTRVSPQAPVVAMDMDGVISRYHSHFEWFCNLYLQKTVVVDWSRSNEFNEALGIDKHTYREIKLAFRQGGMRRSMPIFRGMRSMCRQIRESGNQLWICGTQPYLSSSDVDKDLLFWLENNMIEVDGILYGDTKYEDLVDIVGLDRIVCAVDDLPEQCLAAHELGIHTIMRAGSHNHYFIYEAAEKGIAVGSSIDPLRFLIQDELNNYGD